MISRAARRALGWRIFVWSASPPPHRGGRVLWLAWLLLLLRTCTPLLCLRLTAACWLRTGRAHCRRCTHPRRSLLGGCRPRRVTTRGPFLPSWAGRAAGSVPLWEWPMTGPICLGGRLRGSGLVVRPTPPWRHGARGVELAGRLMGPLCDRTPKRPLFEGVTWRFEPAREAAAPRQGERRLRPAGLLPPLAGRATHDTAR